MSRVYLGEDIIHKINFKAVMEHINDITTIKYYKHNIYESRNEISYYEENNWGSNSYKVINELTIKLVRIYQSECFWFYDSNYLADNWRQDSNNIIGSFADIRRKIPCAYWILKENRKRKARLKRIREVWERVKKGIIIKRITLNKGFDTTQMIRKKNIIDIYFQEEDIFYNTEGLQNGFCQENITERNNTFHSDIQQVKVNQYKRYMRLYTEINKVKNKCLVEEQLYYMLMSARLIVGRGGGWHNHNNKKLCYKYVGNIPYNLSEKKLFMFLGTEYRHIRTYFINDTRWSNPYSQNSIIDFTKDIDRISGDYNKWDLYGEAFQKKLKKYNKFSGDSPVIYYL